MKSVLLSLLLLLVLASAMWGQSTSPVSLVLNPGATIPLGSSRDFYTFGASLNLAANYTLPFAPLLFVSGVLQYDLLPLATERSLSILYAGATAGLQYHIRPRMRIAAAGGGGLYLGVFDGETGPGLYLAAGAQATYQFTPSLSLGLGGGYQNCLARPYALFQGFSINFVSRFHLGQGSRKPQLQIQQAEIEPIFPVLYKYYDDHPVGRITLVNEEKGTIEDVEITFFISQYMEKPKTCTVLTGLRSGEQSDVNLFALFNERVLEITEGTKVPAEVTVSYNYLDSEFVKQETYTARVYDRNAVTWDDDRKAAAFISAKDPAVLKFSKSVAGAVRDTHRRGVNETFRVALGLFQGLGAHGLSYVVDPKTPYAEFSRNALALDYLQFPRHTLEYSAGDCDDLSILYNALAESVGIETAFITVPGHIYAAVSLGMDREQAKRLFGQSEDIIILEGRTWLPLETTLVDQGFIKAWRSGARQWREHADSGEAKLYPVHEAWELYEPVGMIGADPGIRFPEKNRLVDSYNAEMDRFVEQQIAPEVTRLQAHIRQGGSSRIVNSLGVLYARYGLLDKAGEQFLSILNREEYVPAMINLGNLYLLENDYGSALELFEKAEDREPENASVLLNLARIHFEQGDYSASARYHDRLAAVNLELASRHSYLAAAKDNSARGAITDTEQLVIWEEEE